SALAGFGACSRQLRLVSASFGIRPGPPEQGGLPVKRQGARGERSLQQIWVAGLAKVELFDIGDRDLIGIARQDLNLRAGADLAGLNDGEIKAASAAGQEALNHIVAGKPER